MASFNFKLADGNSLPGVGLGVFMMEGPDCVSAVLAALAAGYRHIDTAQSYNNEAAVGEGLKASGVPRESVYITTKLWPGNPAWGMPLPRPSRYLAPLSYELPSSSRSIAVE